MWYNEENAFYKKMPLPSKLVHVIKAGLYLLFADGIWRSNLFRSDITLSTPVISIGNVLIFIIAVFVIGRLFAYKENDLPYPIRRTIGILLFCFMVAGVITLFLEDTNYIRYALAGYYFIGAFCLLGLLVGMKFVKNFYMIHDIVCAHIIFIPLFVLAALQLPGHIQTWLLYHNALSADVVVSDILRYARKTQESSGMEADDDLAEQVAELKKIVQKQEQLLAGAGLLEGGRSPEPNESGVADILSSHAAVQPQPSMPTMPMRASTGGRYGRAFSMSGMDVWGDMALGDTGELREQSGIPSGDTQPMSSVASSSMQGFSFTQPDTMPPR